MLEMEAYLSTTLDKLRSDHFGDLTIVLGNESCDLDSAVSALVYSTFLYWQYSQIKCKVCTRLSRDETTYRDDIFVPFLNVKREDYDLKTEVVHCFKQQGIHSNHLVFRDDFDLQSLVNKNKTSVVLVDHHSMSNNDSILTDLVTEIIDHRPIDKDNWKFKPDTRTTIELVGSCCTLVVQRIRALGALLAKEVDFFHAYPQSAHLLHSCIILDTVNFSKEVNKATPADEAAVAFLDSLMKMTDPLEFRQKKLDELMAVRKDVSKLTVAQLLRKDTKVFGNVFIPSFPVLVEDILNKPNAIDAILAAIRHYECTAAVLLGMSLQDTLRRDVAVCAADDKELASKLAKFLQEWKTPPLQLTPKEPKVKNCLYFIQNNLSASRKQYIPAIKEFIQQNHT